MRSRDDLGEEEPSVPTAQGVASAGAEALLPSDLQSQLKQEQADDLEEFASRIMRRAASLTGVRIDRVSFLRTEIRKRCPEIDPELAVASTPVAAGVSPFDLDEIALSVIDFETKKCAGISFITGVPGGAALLGTVPADIAQYFAHVMRVEQKLAYLYGWQTFLNDDDEVDDQTIMNLVVLMGVMMNVGGVATSLTKFATDVAQKGVAKTIQRQALTKAVFYNPMKSVLRVLGVNLTKQSFAKGVSKVVPVVGGVISGGLTYASFKPGAERLRRYLRSLPTSGIDENVNPDISAIRADARRQERAEAVEAAKEAVADGAHLVVGACERGVKASGLLVSRAARSARDAAGALSGAVKLRGGGAKGLPKTSGTRREEPPAESGGRGQALPPDDRASCPDLPVS